MGVRKGRAEGRTRTLLDRLGARFGAVPATAKERILAASETMLARWSLRVLTAPSIEAVLAGGAVKKAKKAAPARPAAQRPARARRA